VGTNLYTPDGFAVRIFQDRYAIHPDETFHQACERVARCISDAEMGVKRDDYFARFLEVINTNRFSPGGRIWRGAGRPRGQLLNCFCIPAEDSREGWGDVLRNVTIISGTGGGVGINFSKIRPRGMPIRGTGGEATGAVSLMRAVNAVCNELREGGGRRCLPKNTLIHTKRGLVPIKNIIIGDFVQTYSGYQQVIAKENTGYKHLIDIQTQMGVFQSSPDHRWAVLSDLDGSVKWICAKDLNPDDRLIFLPNGIDGIKTELPQYKYIKPKMSTTCKDISIPKLDTEIAWMIGNIHGDGHVCPKRKEYRSTVSVACADTLKEQEKRSIAAFKKFGNHLHVGIRRKSKEKCSKPTVTSEQLCQYFSQFKLPKQSINVPDFILQAVDSIRCAYIAGVLDSDGNLETTNKKQLPAIASSIYPDFLRQLRAILSSLGIIARIKLCRKAIGNWKDLYVLEVITIESMDRFKEKIGPFSSKYRKYGLLERKKEHNSLTIPWYLLRKFDRRNMFHNTFWKPNARAECSFQYFMDKTGEQRYRPIKVLGVSLGNTEQETYDIQIENDEMFVAEGMLVHNSALLFCLNWNHPDLLEFLEAKLDNKELTNANISVLIDDDFLQLLKENGEIILKWQGEERDRVPARNIWDKIIQNAWKNGDPGFLNAGLINNQNTIAYVRGGEFSSTNPCGEVVLEEYGCCCLGAINLHTHVVNNDIDWDLLEETVATGVRFLDNVLEQNNYPLPIIQETCQKHRRIGLGVMGLHDMLLELGLKYSSEQARELVDKVMDFIKKQAYHASIALAIEKGPFHALDVEQHIKTGFLKKSLGRRHHRLIKEHGIRNCALLTIAPTGTTSIVAGCSSGIEPLFHPIYKRRFNKHSDMHDDAARDGAEEIVIHPLLHQFLAARRSTKHFQGAHDISPRDHLAMQAICQKHIDNSIAKTINLPHDYSVEQLSKDMEAAICDLKGITVYRDGSKGESPFVPVPIKDAKEHFAQLQKEASVHDCPSGACEVNLDKKKGEMNG